MSKKARAETPSGSDAQSGDFPQNLKEMSRQIWLAGLGAFSRAQAEGMKMFDTLVEQGVNLESRTRRAATQTAQAAADAAAQKAKEVQAMAGGTWDKLEQVFEDRVARALSKLGVYTQEDVTRLAERVDALSEAVNALIRARDGKPAAKRVAPVKKTARKAPRKAPTEAKSEPAAATVRKTRKRRPA